MLFFDGLKREMLEAVRRRKQAVLDVFEPLIKATRKVRRTGTVLVALPREVRTLIHEASLVAEDNRRREELSQVHAITFHYDSWEYGAFVDEHGGSHAVQMLPVDVRTPAA